MTIKNTPLDIRLACLDPFLSPRAYSCLSLVRLGTNSFSSNSFSHRLSVIVFMLFSSSFCMFTVYIQNKKVQDRQRPICLHLFY